TREPSAPAVRGLSPISNKLAAYVGTALPVVDRAAPASPDATPAARDPPRAASPAAVPHILGRSALSAGAVYMCLRPQRQRCRRLRRDSQRLTAPDGLGRDRSQGSIHPERASRSNAACSAVSAR